MPKGTTTGDLDAYMPVALGQQDMRMLMTPFMRRFTAVLARKGMAAKWQFAAMPWLGGGPSVSGTTQSAARTGGESCPGL